MGPKGVLEKNEKGLKNHRSPMVMGGLIFIGSPPVTPPPLFFFQIPIVLFFDNFFMTLGSAIQFSQKFDLGGNKDIFRFWVFSKKT
jgi:hypothetical protein